MRAVRYSRFGPPEVLELAELPEPVPGAGEVKVKVFAAGLNPLDWKIRAGHVRLLPMFAQPPRTTGKDYAGEIVGIGGGPGKRFVGERVFGSLSPFLRDGSCAEYVVAKAEHVAPIPAGISFEAAAATPIAGGTALQALTDDAQLHAGQRCLITGAAGGVGHFAVQIAKHLGAYVVATCGAANVAFVRALGADEVLDYSREDPTARSDLFDVIFDVADVIGFTRARARLANNGIYVGTGGSAGTAALTAAASVFAPLLTGKRARLFVLKHSAALWRRLGELLASGAIVPHIEQRVPLEAVAEAQRRMETGHGRGKRVVLPQGPM